VARDHPDQRDRVARHDHGDGQGHRRVKPVPAPDHQDDRPRRRHPGRGGGIGDGVEQDRRHRQVPPARVGIPAQDQCPGRHHQRRDAARHQHRQAVYVRRAGGQPVDRRAGHGQLEQQQPSGVDQGGGPGRAQAAAASAPGRESDGRHGPARARGIEEIVAGLGQHSQRMRAGSHRMAQPG
jgi:hypothetical protein